MTNKLADSAGGMWRPWTIWLPGGLGLVWSGLLLLGYAAAGIMGSWDTAVPGLHWVGVGAVGQCALAVVTIAVLTVGATRPRWRRAAAVAIWTIIAIGLAWFWLTGRLVSGS